MTPLVSTWTKLSFQHLSETADNQGNSDMAQHHLDKIYKDHQPLQAFTSKMTSKIIDIPASQNDNDVTSM